MELMVVRTEDVYPDENNPRQDFSGTEELAESFWLNPERPGEPFQPPLLVRDGGIFRIYDGERRFRGIQHNKLDSFTANVCDDFEEADVMIAMLATNDKKPLSAIEESRGVQRMLRLGVDPVKVEKAARIGRGKASKVATAMAIVDDAGEDMTLDRMYAVAEFADDAEDVEKIMNCREGQWALEAARIRQRREAMAKAALIKEKADELGIEYTEIDSFEASNKGYYYSWDLTVRSPNDLEKAYGEHPDALFSPSGHGEILYVYLPREDNREPTSEEIELEKKAGEFAEAYERAICDLSEWFVAAVSGRGAATIPEVRDIVVDAYHDAIGYDSLFDTYPELCGADLPSKTDLAYGLSKALSGWKTMSQQKAQKMVQGKYDYETCHAADIADLFTAAESDGFTFADDGLAKEVFDAFIAGTAADDEDEDEDEAF